MNFFNINITTSKRASRVALACALVFMPFFAHAVQRELDGTLYISYVTQDKDTYQSVAKKLLRNPEDWRDIAKFNNLDATKPLMRWIKIRVPLNLARAENVPVKLVAATGDVHLVGGTAANMPKELPEGSKVQTGNNSSAALQLADGSTVKLLPNTTIEIKRHAQYSDPIGSVLGGPQNWFIGALRLLQGKIENIIQKHPDGAEPLRVETPTSYVGVRGTEFRVSYDAETDKTTRVELTKGLVDVSKSNALASDSSLTGQSMAAELALLAKQGVLVASANSEQKLYARPLLPAPSFTTNAVSSTPEGETILTWNPINNAKSYNIQVARNEELTQIVRTASVEENSVSLSGLPKGKWYAVVRGVDVDGLQGMDGNYAFGVTQSSLKLPWNIEKVNFGGASQTLSLQVADYGLVRNMKISTFSDAALKNKLSSTVVQAKNQLQLPLSGFQSGDFVYVLLQPMGDAGEVYSGLLCTVQIPSVSASGVQRPLRYLIMDAPINSLASN